MNVNKTSKDDVANVKGMALYDITPLSSDKVTVAILFFFLVLFRDGKSGGRVDTARDAACRILVRADEFAARVKSQQVDISMLQTRLKTYHTQSIKELKAMCYNVTYNVSRVSAV